MLALLSPWPTAQGVPCYLHDDGVAHPNFIIVKRRPRTHTSSCFARAVDGNVTFDLSRTRLADRVCSALKPFHFSQAGFHAHRS